MLKDYGKYYDGVKAFFTRNRIFFFTPPLTSSFPRSTKSHRMDRGEGGREGGRGSGKKKNLVTT